MAKQQLLKSIIIEKSLKEYSLFTDSLKEIFGLYIE